MSRFYYEFNQPSGTMSLDNLRDNMRALHQLDMLTLRTRAQETPDLTVEVSGSEPGDYYKNVYVTNQPLSFTTGDSPSLTAPAANPRIDILTVNSAGTLSFVSGDEAASPEPKWASLSSSVMPLALVYCKTTMTTVVNYEDKDANPNEGYIHSDVRPFIRLAATDKIQDSDGDTRIETEESADEDTLRFYAEGVEAMTAVDDLITSNVAHNIADELQADGDAGTSGDSLISRGAGFTPEYKIPNGRLKKYLTSEAGSFGVGATSNTWVDSGITSITFTPDLATNIITIFFGLGVQGTQADRMAQAAIDIGGSRYTLYKADRQMGPVDQQSQLIGSFTIQLPASSQTVKIQHNNPESGGTITSQNGFIHIKEEHYVP